jgi:hypothetical protein
MAACSAAGTDDADSQAANATGGTTQDEASFLHVFAANEETPVCAGAIIADKAIVVPRSCVRDNLEVGLASRGDNPFSWNKTKVTKIHIPERGPADIAVLEIEKQLASSANLVTRAPLRAGYTIFARQSVKDGIFGNPVGYTTQMPGALLTATETQATILPQTGAKLCMRDLGAMVCSSTESTGLLGLGPRDRCGLAGIVVAPPDSGTLDLDECSGEGWKIAPLGLYADFLKQFAPKLFNPIVDSHIFGTSTFVPDGLWGYDSAGDVKSCELSTPKLDPAKKNVKQLVRGKASFEGMGGHAEAIAHFGIAKKNSPNVITWIPAQRGSLVKATAFDDKFTADVGAAVDGDYLVTLRISANGGESWKRCDDATKPLSLTVGDSSAPTNPPTIAADAGAPPPPSGSDAGAPPPPSGSDAGTPKPDSAGDDDDDTSAPVPAPTDPPAAPTHPKTPKSSESGENGAAPGGEDRIVPAATTTTPDSGSSTAPGSGSSNLPMIGLLFGLVALARRRRVNGS